MIMTNKLLPVALIAALIGGSVGALVMHKSQPASAETAVASDYTARPAAPVATQQTVADNNELVPGEFNTASEQTAPTPGATLSPASDDSGAYAREESCTFAVPTRRALRRNGERLSTLRSGKNSRSTATTQPKWRCSESRRFEDSRSSDEADATGRSAAASASGPDGSPQAGSL